MALLTCRHMMDEDDDDEDEEGDEDEDMVSMKGLRAGITLMSRLKRTMKRWMTEWWVKPA